MDADYGHYPIGDDGDWSFDPDEIEIDIEMDLVAEPDPFLSPFLIIS